MSYDDAFVNPLGQTSRESFLPAMLTVLIAFLFFFYMVTGRTAEFCNLVLVYPAFVLLTRRVRDIGYPGWLMLFPLLLVLAAFGIRLDYLSLGDMPERLIIWAAILAVAAIACWGSISSGKAA